MAGPVAAEGKNAAADLIAQGDKIQFADRRFRREIAAWLVSNRSNRRDGLPGHTKGFGDLMSMGAPVLVRTFDRGNEIAAKERELASGSPLLAVMGTEQDDERSWLQCGMAMQRVLLLACVHGISASFLNQPLEVDELRPKFAALTSEMGQKDGLSWYCGWDLGPACGQHQEDLLVTCSFTRIVSTDTSADCTGFLDHGSVTLAPWLM